MLDDTPVDDSTTPAASDDASSGTSAAPAKKAAAKKAPAKKAAAKKAPAKKAAAKKTAAAEATTEDPTLDVALEPGDEAAPAKKAAKKAPAKKAAAKKAPAKKVAAPVEEPAVDEAENETGEAEAEAAAAVAAAPPTMLLFKAPDPTAAAPVRRTRKAAASAETPADTSADTSADSPAATDEAPAPAKRTRSRKPAAARDEASDEPTDETDTADASPEETSGARNRGGRKHTNDHDGGDLDTGDAGEVEGEDRDNDDQDNDGEGGGRRRRRRGGRRRRKSGDGESQDSGSDQGGNGQDRQQNNQNQDKQDKQDGGKQDGRGGNRSGDQSRNDSDDDSGEGGTSRRRRRRRRSGDDGPDAAGDPENTVTRVRRQRNAEDEITAISGSTRLEAKKQRRRDGREAGRRRAPIVSEAEFLARREAVDRVMVIRQQKDLTQIAVLEDKVLVEHYVSRESQTSIIGNVYLGRVQNVLPSMEAAFIDIGKGRNAVLYAGEVNWSALGHRDGQPRKIESVLSSGQSVLVQVTKDPIGHKGARLTSQVSLAGRFLVYVPDGTTSGISRKLPDTERARLKALLKEIVPESAGVIVRTAAEGASEDELTRDVERLKARWEDIEAKLKGQSPQLLYGEPDLTLKVVRDLFTEDFSKLVIEGDDAWDTVQSYVQHLAPDLEERLERYDPSANNGKDSFAAHRIEEQIAKGLDRKVWLPSGGSLVIDRTEAMTVVDVNTGKFTGSGGNLEETVTKNNLEAAEEMVRQLRLRDIGGIIVIDFIDMVLESNRDLVLRRLVECLGRDRTRHQVAEVTSLGLVQMTRKRIGTGLVETFSENCTHCQGRGVVIQDTPVEPTTAEDDSRRGGGGGNSRRSRGGRGRGQDGDDQNQNQNQNQGGSGGKATPPAPTPSPSYVAAVAKPENAEKAPVDEAVEPAVQQKAGEEQAGEVSAEETPASTEPPKVVTRSRRRGGGRSSATTTEPTSTEAVAPVEAPVAAPDETPAEVAVQPAEQPAEQQSAAEPAPAEAAPAAPKVVTTTRRRSASRPVTTMTPVTPVTTEVASVAEAAPVVAAAPAAAPKVVTRTRGRSAARPAGPPSVEAGESTPAETGAEPEGEHVEHVPIKKKGSRKR
ncbi:Rne/Rng family ribonuclease [Nocardioides sp.]|uniref:Rne/Rng family ribonuclease n=1 Tax=Nocardioides sp. TaxID=35761 RepID=UPI0035636025